MNVCAADMQILERVGSEGRGYTCICMKIYAYNVCVYALRKCIHMCVCIYTHIMYESMWRRSFRELVLREEDIHTYV